MRIVEFQGSKRKLFSHNCTLKFMENPSNLLKTIEIMSEGEGGRQVVYFYQIYPRISE